jgi:hypothetical protein
MSSSRTTNGNGNAVASSSTAHLIPPAQASRKRALSPEAGTDEEDNTNGNDAERGTSVSPTKRARSVAADASMVSVNGGVKEKDKDKKRRPKKKKKRSVPVTNLHRTRSASLVNGASLATSPVKDEQRGEARPTSPTPASAPSAAASAPASTSVPRATTLPIQAPSLPEPVASTPAPESGEPPLSEDPQPSQTSLPTRTMTELDLLGTEQVPSMLSCNTTVAHVYDRSKTRSSGSSPHHPPSSVPVPALHAKLSLLTPQVLSSLAHLLVKTKARRKQYKDRWRTTLSSSSTMTLYRFSCHPPRC